MSIQCVKISQIYNLPASEWNENNESNKTTLKLKTDFKLKKRETNGIYPDILCLLIFNM